MSNFIKNMFSNENKDTPRKYIRERLSTVQLDMTNSKIEAINIPKQIINFTFRALWKMNASGTAEEYDEIHKIAIQALTRDVYKEFYTKLTYLELALYNYDREKAKEIIQEIKKEVGI